MTDLISFVLRLRRPSLLLRAARMGLADYDRARMLRRLTKSQELPEPSRAVRALIGVESELEQARQQGDASYTPSRHVEVLIALLAEVQQLARPRMQA